MPQTYDAVDCRIELESELASTQDDLKAEIAAHKETTEELNRYRRRVVMEQKKFYQGDEPVTFANTETMFEIGDNVKANGKEYEIYEFYQSVHAKKNEVDWLKLRRRVEGTTFWANVNPSEATIISWPVPSVGGNPGNFTEFPNE